MSKYFVCVDGLLLRDGKLLLLKRNVEPFMGFWHVIGGHVDPNETLQDALKREFREETGLDVEIGDIVDGRIERTPDRVKIIIAFTVHSAKGEIRLNAENSDYGWFTEIPPNSVYNYFKSLQDLF